MTKSQRIEIRVSESEKAAWAQTAGGQRRVSEWLRSLANAAIASEPLVSEPKILAEKVSVSTKHVVVPKKDCPRAHHHRPGVYCGSCGKVN
jgi:hypothetical protein